MNLPVRAPFAIFARAIERVDDPDPLMGQALRGVDALFGQDAVVGTLGPEGVENIVTGYLVAGDTERAPVQQARLPDRQQDFAGRSCQLGGELRIGHAKSLSTMRSAARSDESRVGEEGSST